MGRHAFTNKEKLYKPNPALTMAADKDATNGEQEVLRTSKSPHYSEYKKYLPVSTQQALLFPEQQPLTEPTAKMGLTSLHDSYSSWHLFTFRSLNLFYRFTLVYVMHYMLYGEIRAVSTC